MSSRRSAALIALLAVVGILAWTAPAAAQPAQGSGGGQPPGPPPSGATPPPSQPGPVPTDEPIDQAAVEQAIDALFLETAVLVELGGFGPSPNAVLREVADSVAPLTNPDGLGLAPLLERADQTAAAALPKLTGPSLETTQALGALGVANLSSAQAGGVVTHTADGYLLALDDLVARGGRPPIDADGTPLPRDQTPVDISRITTRLALFSWSNAVGDTAATTPTTAGQRSSTPSTTTAAAGAAAASSDSSSALPVVAVLLVIGVLLLVGAGWMVGRSRRNRERTVEHDLDDMLEVTRLLTNATEPGSVGDVAVREAIRLTEAAAGAFVVRDGQQLVIGSQHPDGVLVADHLGEGVLGRVVDTGQPIATISATEQAVANLPASLLAAPVISGGSVAAVILVLRHNERPFDRSDTDTLVRLAPVVASAFEAAQQRGRLEEMTLVDPLTSLGNRRAFDRDIVASLASSRAQGSVCSMIMIDVDHFKRFNDDFGHAAGDDVLRSVGRVLAETVRPVDHAYRYGGEEFAVLLPATSGDEAAAVAERLRAAVEATELGPLVPDGTRVTASLGVAAETGDDAASLQRRADEALYEAKAGGRNRVTSGVPSG